MNSLEPVHEVAAAQIAHEAAVCVEASGQDNLLASQLAAADQQRWGNVEDVRRLRSMQPYLPQLPESEAWEVFERVQDAERQWASPTLLAGGYGGGVATSVDEVRIQRGNSAMLMSADHATDPVRKITGRREDADHGTAGLAVLLAQEGLVDAVIPVGRQTGNANVTPDAPLKRVLAEELRTTAAPRLGFISLHGKVPGHVTHPLETTEIHALIGLGKYEPNEQTLTAVEAIRNAAREELGLRVEVANTTPFLVYKKDPAWQPGGPIRDKLPVLTLNDETGLPKTSRLAALGDGTTTNFVAEQLQAAEGYPDIPHFQVEMSRSLRLTPPDRFNRDPQAMAMGVYLGYLLNRRIVEICQDGMLNP